MRKLNTLLAIILTTNMLAQSPWTQEKGKAYTQVSFTTIPNYNTLFGEPDYNTNGNITDNTLQFYAEYGISKNTSLLVNIPIKMISINNYIDPRIDCIGDCSKDFSKTALGNIEVGLKHNFYNNKWLLSGQFNVETNTGVFDATSGIRTGYNAFTFTPLFLAGKSLNKGYLQAFIGANIRTNNYSSNFKIGGEIGRKVTKKIWLIGFIDIAKSLKNGNILLPFNNTSNGLFVNNQEYGIVGLKVIGEFSNNFGVTAGIPAAFFGNNLPKKLALTIGVYKKF